MAQQHKLSRGTHNLDGTYQMSSDGAIHELPPSPIRSPGPEEESQLDQELPEKRRDAYLPSVLSLLRTTHRYSAYTFSAFSVIHFLNTGVAPLLSPVSDLTFANENLTAARALYQNSYLSEAVLVFGALGIHILSGTAIRLIRIGREYVWYKHHARFPSMSWNARTGYLIAPFVIGHVAANRWMPWKLDIDVTSSVVGHWIGRNPWIGWSFYGLFVSASAFHIANGAGQWLGWKKQTRSRVNAAVVVLWLAGLVKVAAHGIVGGFKGKQYDAIERALYDLLPLRNS